MTPCATPIAASNHSLYSWTIVTFLVEEQLFKVPRDHFTSGSPVFAEMLAEKQVDDADCSPSVLLESATVEQRVEEVAFPLGGVTSHEFETFLKLVFPSLTSSITLKLSRSEWLVVLKLSTMWNFSDHRKLAITQLTKYMEENPMKAVKYAREVGVYEWLLSGYFTLAQRDEPLNENEAAQLGLPVAFNLCGLRERWLLNKYKRQGLTDTAFKEIVRSRFEDELLTIREQQTQYSTTEEAKKQKEVQQELARKEKLGEEIQKARERLRAAEKDIREREAQLSVY
ncbi:hypothetical protein D9611_003684 [Ephemerocybe angulata]|uniref:BTB domain-containing protein n=1 Tax=Ephemerocybe angulata TaxID=980116 RepID=A0A8H5B778_9AGAR|nr:hypothetical protein D9611_003684 [Tulosesus angulatus]